MDERFASGAAATSVVGSTAAWLAVGHSRYQVYLDRTTPHAFHRWLATGILLFVLMLRVIVLQGFYVVAYAVGIYLLNLLLLFLSPRFDPSGELFGDLDGGDEEGAGGLSNAADLSPPALATQSGGSVLPTGRDDEFRPFVRRLPEFRFWYNATRALLFALCCTLFSVFDIPVFWPILLVYFIILTVLTMRRQIGHMVKHKYVPFDFGKKVYTST